MAQQAPSLLELIEKLRESDDESEGDKPYPSPVSVGGANFVPCRPSFEKGVNAITRDDEHAIACLKRLGTNTTATASHSSPCTPRQFDWNSLDLIETDRSSSLYAWCSTSSDSPPSSPSPVRVPQFNVDHSSYAVTVSAQVDRTKEENSVIDRPILITGPSLDFASKPGSKHMNDTSQKLIQLGHEATEDTVSFSHKQFYRPEYSSHREDFVPREQPFNDQWSEFIKPSKETGAKSACSQNFFAKNGSVTSKDSPKRYLEQMQHDQKFVSQLVKEDLAAYRRSRHANSQGSLRESLRTDVSLHKPPGRHRTASGKLQSFPLTVVPPVPVTPVKYIQPSQASPFFCNSKAIPSPGSPTLSILANSMQSSIDSQMHSVHGSPLESFDHAGYRFNEAKNSCDYSIVPKPLVFRKNKDFDAVGWWKLPKPSDSFAQPIQERLFTSKHSPKLEQLDSDDDDGSSTVILARKNAEDSEDDRTTIRAVSPDRYFQESITPSSPRDIQQEASTSKNNVPRRRRATAEDYSEDDFPVFEAFQRESVALPCAPVTLNNPIRVVREQISIESLGRPCSEVIVEEERIEIPKTRPFQNRPIPMPIKVNGTIYRRSRYPPVLTEIHPTLRSPNNVNSSDEINEDDDNWNNTNGSKTISSNQQQFPGSGTPVAEGKKDPISEEKMRELMLAVKAANMIADKNLGKLPLGADGQPDCAVDYYPLRRVPTAEIERNIAMYKVPLKPLREENFKTKTAGFFKRVFSASKHKKGEEDPNSTLNPYPSRNSSEEKSLERERRLRLIHSTLMGDSPLSPTFSSPRTPVFERRECREWLDTVYDDVFKDSDEP